MQSIIRISGKSSWGTTFCVPDGTSLRFHTAAHVLVDCGVQVDASSSVLNMCDGQSRFLMGPNPFELTNIAWDLGCDLVSYSSDFPGMPFASGVCPIAGTAVQLHGYLWQGGGSMPDCGLSMKLDGTILSAGRDGQCVKTRLSLDVRTPVNDLNGMSGGPVVDANTGHVIALLNGAPAGAGGPPFIATVPF